MKETSKENQTGKKQWQKPEIKSLKTMLTGLKIIATVEIVSFRAS